MVASNINLDELMEILLLFKEEGATLINVEVVHSSNTLRVSYKKDPEDFEVNIKDMI